ncbi:hypothetical protein M9H77_24230 [Catharanthus roseus]|uniref:Uncharacterized protein n=1 Tax=Catharanthus roseus TaxID=4058 RepID=A0ACC0AY55_CATRO|nr:hypothetical protein M9H77_24230 [Catharanthus roseus]
MWLSIKAIATSEKWQLFIYDGRHNHKIAVYYHGHAQAARLTEEQLKQTEQFKKTHVPPHMFFIPLMKQRRNTVEEVLYLNVERGYTVFYRNCEDGNVLSGIVITHPTSIAMIRTWPYVLIMDTTYKTNKVWTSEVLHFGVETTNYAESEHSILKLWLSTCHGDLDTVFLNVDSVMKCEEQCHIEEYKQSHQSLGFEEDMSGHYLRKSHGLPCACELLGRYEHFLLLKLEDVSVFWRTLEIRVDFPQAHARDMDFEIHDLTFMLDQISTGPTSKVREYRRLIKGVLCPVLSNDPCTPLTSPLEHAVTKGRRKTNSTKRNKSYWEHVSITHMKIGKSSGSGFGSGSGSGSGSRGRGRLPRAPRHKGRGRSSGQSSLSYVVNLSTPSTLPYIDAFSEFVYEFIQNWRNVVGDERVYEVLKRAQWFDGPAPQGHWLETPDHFYVIANTFNFCMVLTAVANGVGVDGISEVLCRPLKPRDEAVTVRPSTQHVLSVTGPRSSSLLRPSDPSETKARNALFRPFKWEDQLQSTARCPTRKPLTPVPFLKSARSGQTIIP